MSDGPWASPVAAADAAAGVERAEALACSGGVYWLEHSFDGGVSRVMRAAAGRPATPATPAGVDVGSLVWEYGGGAFLVHRGAVVYADRRDQRLYRLDPGGAPRPLTPLPPAPRSERFADGSVAPGGRWGAYVNESHRGDGDVEQRLVAVSLESAAAPRVLARGRDFYAAPRISPDGRRLAWLCWDKPNMPWDGSELWLAAVGADGTLQAPQRLAGGLRESVLQPRWSPDGTLHWVSDRSGWWNLEALGAGGARVRLAPDSADYATPPWHLGCESYGFLGDGTIAAVRARDGVHAVVRLVPGRTAPEPLGPPLTHVTRGHLSCHGNRVALVAATPTAGASLLEIDAASGRANPLLTEDDAPDPRLVTPPEPLWIRRPDGTETHGVLYRPSPAPPGPAPLVLNLHGGPTDAAATALDLERLLWTSRGFAVLDLNYSGSSGFGRPYRERLYGAWGEADLADCVAAVESLTADRGVDPARVVVRGGSAGGYLALQCAVRSSRFRGGLCRAGIADVALWREQTHDFESRYPDLLVGPPSEAARYAAASPVRHVGSGAAPVLLVHGAVDPVVPPAQAVLAADAYRRAGRPHRLLLLGGEPHDFRRAAARRRWLEAELDFCRELLGD